MTSLVKTQDGYFQQGQSGLVPITDPVQLRDLNSGNTPFVDQTGAANVQSPTVTKSSQQQAPVSPDPYTKFNTAIAGILQSAQNTGSNAPLYASQDQLKNQALNMGNPLNDTPYKSIFAGMTPEASLAAQKGTTAAFNPGITSITDQINAGTDALSKFTALAGVAQNALGSPKDRYSTVPISRDLLGNISYGKLDTLTGTVTPISGGGNSGNNSGVTPGASPKDYDTIVAQADPNIKSSIRQSSIGNTYIDGSKLSGNLQQLGQIQAGKLGIPYLDGDTAGALVNLDNARYNQATINAYIQKILPTDATGRVLAAPGTALSQIFQTNDQKAAFNTFRTAAINSLRATAGSQGLRINQAEITQAVDNDIPTLNDTLATANQKYAIIKSLLDNTEQAMVGQNRTTAVPASASTGISVTAPNGKTYSFKDQASADAFKQKAGIQ